MNHTCGTPLVYNIQHDALFCPKCDVWQEVKCPDPDCVRCKNRPEKPSQVQVTEQKGK